MDPWNTSESWVKTWPLQKCFLSYKMAFCHSYIQPRSQSLLTASLSIWSLREVSFFIGRGLWKFFKFCEFLVIPPTVWVKFSDPPWGIAEFKWSPQPHNKSGRISFCIRSWDWPSLGFVKSEGREFKRNFDSCSNKTTKFASYQYLLHDRWEI